MQQDEDSSSLQGESTEVSEINAEIQRSEGSDEQLIDNELVEPPSWIIDINRRLLVLEECNNTNVDNGGGNLGSIFERPDTELDLDIKMKAFRPDIAGIGPHFLGSMIEDEKRLLVRLLGAAGRKKKKKSEVESSSSNSFKNGVKLEDLVNAMKLLEEKTRACYPAARYANGDFVEMMVLNGCFVIEILRLHWQFKHSSKDNVVEDPIFRSPSTIEKLQRDFLIFGNQLPFFVLKELYRLTSDNNSTEPPLRCLAIDFLKEFTGSEDVISLLEDDPKADDCHHLLHLFSYACTSKPQRYLTLQKEKLVVAYRGRKLTYNAKELQEAGVKIKPPTKHAQEDNHGGLMSISITKGPTLRIQPFYLDNKAVFTLLNFLCFEKTHPHEANPYFTSYILFLDCLIDSEADVEVLHKAGILNHAFGNNRDVVNLIYKLARGLKDPEYNNFHGEITELNRFCKDYYGSKSRTWWRNLINNYFSSPWTIMSLVAATILLVLTFVQTFYTTYAYYKPPN